MVNQKIVLVHYIVPLNTKLPIAALGNEGEDTEKEGRSEADYFTNRCLLEPGTEDVTRCNR